MGGDLNLKKSWHPSLMSNQKKVWEEEKRALDERKKIEQIRKERDEERQIQELQDLQEAAGGKKRLARVDWMYQGPASGQTGTSEETEAFLLGKRRVDTLLQGNESENLKKNAAQETFMAVQNANTARDTASKVRDDPLLAIKKQEQAAYEAMMSDPIKRRMLLKAAGREEELEPGRKRRKHHHHSSRHKDDNRGRDRDRHRDRDRDKDRDRDRDYSRREGYRSSRHERYRDRGQDRAKVSRRRSSSLSASLSPSRSRSRSPRRSSARRSPPVRRRSSPSYDKRDRSRSPYNSDNEARRVRKTKSWHSTRPRSISRSSSPPKRPSSTTSRQDDKAARLAAMQQDATDLDIQRQQRLQQLAEQEDRVKGQEEAARIRNSKHGGRADFVNGYHKRAGDLCLGERMGRQRFTNNED